MLLVRQINGRLVPRGVLYGIVGVVGFLILASHRPDAVLNAQFWTEDGTTWYPQAYEQGAASIIKPYNGYFHLVPRLVAYIAQALPLAYAPLLFSLVALGIQLLPALFFLSPRMENLIPSVSMRLVFVFMYLFFPNSFEVHANLTNAQTFLALLAFLIITARPAEKKAARIADAAAITLSVFTGPFCLFLLPLAWLRIRKESDRRQWYPLLGIVSFGALVQGISIIITRFSFPSAVVGIPPLMVLEIFVKQVLLGGLFGIHGYEMIEAQGMAAAITVMLSTLAFGLIGYWLLRGPTMSRLIMLFCLLLFLAGLFAPTAPDLVRLSGPALVQVGMNNRYFFLPSLLFILLVFSSFSWPQQRSARFVAGCFLIIFFLYGVRLDWHHPPYRDFQFATRAKHVAQVPPGTTIKIPINPPGWYMTIRK